jgi:hypothetical protein
MSRPPPICLAGLAPMTFFYSRFELFNSGNNVPLILRTWLHVNKKSKRKSEPPVELAVLTPSI